MNPSLERPLTEGRVHVRTPTYRRPELLKRLPVSAIPDVVGLGLRRF